MSSDVSKDRERIEALEGEVRRLTGYDKKLTGIWVAFGIIALLWGWFGMASPISKANDERAKMSKEHTALAARYDTLTRDYATLEKRIEDRKDALAQLDAKITSVDAVADGAMKKAGSLEEAIKRGEQYAKEAKLASEASERASKGALALIEKAQAASEGAQGASERALAETERARVASERAQASADEAKTMSADARSAAERAEQAATKAGSASKSAIHASGSARALAGDLDKNLKGYDQRIASINGWVVKVDRYLRTLRVPNAQPTQPAREPATEPARRTAKRRVIEFVISGHNVDLRLIPGDSALDRYSVSANNYEAEYGIPDNATVVIKVLSTNVKVFAHSRLRGRISPQPGPRAANFKLQYVGR